MGTTLNSLDTIIASAQTSGIYVRTLTSITAAITAATSTSGYITHCRAPDVLTVPSLGTGLTGMYITNFNYTSQLKVGAYLMNEFSLGTLTVSGNVFADGSVMPTKTIRKTSITTASQMAFAVVTTTLVATTPVLTITYTDQNGNTGNTATMTLPTNAAANSAYAIHPHLATGDTGIQDITNISISTGTAGVINIFGCLILARTGEAATAHNNSLPPLAISEEVWLCETGESLAVYTKDLTSACMHVAVIHGVAEN